MPIIVAKTAGFCFGVNRAMETVYSHVDLKQHKTYSLGPVIHNQEVIRDLESRGLTAVASVDEVPRGDAKLLLRTHGVPKAVYDTLKDRGIAYEDLTCPFVKKIHKIVEEHHHLGEQIVIVGDRNHPEVVGINGWCDDCGIVLGEVEDLAKYPDFDPKKPTCLVAQTTLNRKKWEEILKFLKKTCTNLIFFDTICSATNERQAEAAKIAQMADRMFVIGDPKSSNTGKLFEICKQYCERSYLIDTAKRLSGVSFSAQEVIGITAGASTPAGIIKEVILTMEKEMENQELSFAEVFEDSLVTLNKGAVVKGKVIRVTETEVYVDLGFKSDGIIKASELSDDPNVKTQDFVKVGDEIEVFVIHVDDGEGNVLLSHKKIAAMKGWQDVVDALENNTVLTGKVVSDVKGGVNVLTNGVMVFVPASQASDRYLSDLSVLKGQEVSFRIIDINDRRRRAVGSIKSVLVEEREAKAKVFWDSAEEGKTYKGVVRKLTQFGAFVDLGGVDGLVHISELSWQRIKNPAEVLSEGQEVEVYILGLDREKKKVSLGYKKASDNPVLLAKEKFHEGDVVTCKVVRMVPFGAFVELIPGIDGLIHISQISNKRIGKPQDVLEIGQEVEAKILSLDLDNKKISLSIRALLPEEAPVAEEAPVEEAPVAEEAPVEEAPAEEAPATEE